MRPTIRALQTPRPLPMNLKLGVILLYLTNKVSVKVSRISVGGIAYKPTSKVVAPSRTYWSLPWTKTPWSAKVGPLYWFQCGNLTCDDEYMGETSRTFGERFKEHLKDPSPIHHHSNNTGHPTSQNNFQIIGREGMYS